MKRWRIAALCGVLLAAAAGLVAVPWLAGQEQGPATARVAREDLELVVQATGKLEAAVAFEIGPPSARDFWEYNLAWMIPEGTHVKQGDVVARFDTTELDDRLRDHRATLETTLQEREKEQRNLEVELRRLRLDLVRAEGELKVVDLDLAVPQDLVAQIDFERARLKKELAQQRVAFLREKIEFEQQSVATKLELLDVKRAFSEAKIAYNEEIKLKFEVRAPVSGLVVYVPKHNGDRWEVGEGVWMLAKILEVADVSTLQVEANVLEVDAARIAPGQPARITVDAVPGLELAADVAEIGRIVHERSLQDRSKVFDAILPLGQLDLDTLRPGMGVQVEIETERLRDVLTVPLEAVRTSPEGPYVLVDKSGVIERRPVVLGQRNRERVVVASGLAESETLLVEPSS